MSRIICAISGTELSKVLLRVQVLIVVSEACMGVLPLEAVVAAVVRDRVHAYWGWRLVRMKMLGYTSAKVLVPWRQLPVITLWTEHLARLVGVN